MTRIVEEFELSVKINQTSFETCRANKLSNLSDLNENFLLIINKQKLILYFFLTTMTSELSKYLNEHLGVYLNVKQQK